MFVGHFGVGLAAKKFSPKTSLATLFIACQLLDLIWPVAMFLGLESAALNHSVPTFNSIDLIDAPYSHSLGMALFWSCLFGLVIKLFSRSTSAAIVTGATVFSHWILDYITHIPDLPLWFGMEKVGLGLWKSAIATFVVEAAIFGMGVFLFLKAKGTLSKKRAIIFSSMILFLSLFYVMHVFGPKPPETTSPYLVAGPAFALWLIVIWAHLSDKSAA
jgi:membrane-bound metal-dependent hydrolase YbcI (DUF457 family)